MWGVLQRGLRCDDRMNRHVMEKVNNRKLPFKVMPRDLALMMFVVFLVSIGLLTELSSSSAAGSALGALGARTSESLRGAVGHFVARSELVILPTLMTDPSKQTPEIIARTAQVARQLATQGLHVVNIPQNTDPALRLQEQRRRTLIHALNVCAALNTEKCVIMQDSAILHPELAIELAKTIEEMPPTWQVLHMCPGYTWGRAYKNNKRLFHFNPEVDFGVLNTRGKRVFPQWPNQNLAVGGPVAFAVKQSYAARMAERLALPQLEGQPEDIALLKIRTERHFVAKEPQLCYDNPNANQGGLEDTLQQKW